MGGLKTDAPFYTEEELDALEVVDPVAAVRIAREQTLLRRQLAQTSPEGVLLPSMEDLREVEGEVRQILARDGGDIDFVGLDGATLEVRLKGSCGGCPRAPLDLRHVVEALVRRRFPAVTSVKNIF